MIISMNTVALETLVGVSFLLPSEAIVVNYVKPELS